MSKLIRVTVLFYVLNNVCFSQMHLDWVRRYSGPGNFEDSGNSICIDDSGNVYVTGGIQVGSIIICTTIKYNKFGNSIWVREYQRPGNNDNQGNDVVVDDSGNVFVAGAESVIKYNEFGNLIWAKFDSADVRRVILDSIGNIYAGGTGLGYFVVVKYDRNGNRIWKKNDYGANKFYDMVLDKSGNIIFTGQSGLSGTYDYTTIKYSNIGNLVWVRTYNGPASNSDDNSYAVASDIHDNIYVTGSSMDSIGNGDNCLTIKYDSSGNAIWIKRIPTSANIANIGYDIVTDSSQNVYIAGQLNGHTSTIKLNPNGNVIWSRVFPEGYLFGGNYPVILLDSINNIYVTAISNSLYADYAAIKYDNNGNQIFVVTYGNSPMGYDYVEDMAIDKKGRVYLTGRSTSASYDFATVKFSEIITNISSNNIQPSEYKLEQNYPNPFNPSTKFNYELPTANYVTLKVYDIIGNEVATLVNEKQNAGSYEINFDAGKYGMSSGMYFYTLLSGNFSMTKKMILIK